MSGTVHECGVAGEFEHEGYRCRVIELVCCGDPDCGCHFYGSDPLRAFAAPFVGRTDEWLYMGFGNSLDSVVTELADTLSADAEQGRPIFLAACALFGVEWERVARNPTKVISAHENAVAKLDGPATRQLLGTPIGELRRMRARTRRR